MTDPTRLRDDPSVPAHERALLSLEKESAFPYDVAAGVTRFRAELAVLGVAAAAGTAAVARGATNPTSLLTKLATKTLVGFVLPVTGVALAVFAYRAAHEPAATPRGPAAVETRAAAASTETPPAMASAVPIDSLLMEASPSVNGSASPLPRVPSRPAAASPSTARPTPSEHVVLAEDESARGQPTEESAQALAEKPSAARALAEPPKPAEPARPAVTSDTVAEMRAIAEARELLAKDPGKALSILSNARKAHPHGYFGEERSALTILALARSGNLPLAQAQAKVFVRAHPKGPFTDEVRAATGL